MTHYEVVHTVVTHVEADQPDEAERLARRWLTQHGPSGEFVSFVTEVDQDEVTTSGMLRYIDVLEDAEVHMALVVPVPPAQQLKYSSDPNIESASDEELWVRIGEDDWQCRICGADDSFMDSDSFPSYGGSTESYEKCTRCGSTFVVIPDMR